ncbi:MAG: transcription termination factor NusA [Christensenellaceae bacterium]|jgi:N utilization substance protein A|nr:transcription termination factor NusA [Christensenellaceae bacterium]
MAPRKGKTVKTAEVSEEEKKAEFFEAFGAYLEEKHLPREALFEAFEKGFASGYKKDHPRDDRSVKVTINPETQDIKYTAYFKVVEAYPIVLDAEGNEKDGWLNDGEITIDEARVMFNTEYKVDDLIEEDITPDSFSYVASQNAQQAIRQYISEYLRERSKADMSGRKGELIYGIVRKDDDGNLQLELPGSSIDGYLPKGEQIPGESLRINDQIKVYVKKIQGEGKDSKVLLSRADAGYVKKLLEMEVPEIRAGIVKIHNCVREAGYRTKISVYTEETDVDPVGACIGAKGSRINAVVEQLNGEKIDIIPFSNEPAKYISLALAPAKAEFVQLNEAQRHAQVLVPDAKLSLAIGKSGLNAKLAAKLTGYKIDVKPYSESLQDQLEEEANESTTPPSDPLGF